MNCHAPSTRGGYQDRTRDRAALSGGICAECGDAPGDRRLCPECARCIGRADACGHADYCEQSKEAV